MEGIPYLELRDKLAKRDRSLREKVMAHAQAAALGQDGDHVGVRGSTRSGARRARIWQR